MSLPTSSEPYTLLSHEAIARWEELEPLLKRLPTTLTTPLSHVRDMVRNAEAQVWCLGDPVECLLVTKVEHSFETKYGVMWIASGDLRVKEVIKPIVENWFREIGCTHVTLTGRRGWTRTLKDYTEEAVQMVKKL